MHKASAKPPRVTIAPAAIMKAPNEELVREFCRPKTKPCQDLRVL